ncbi:MAG: dethiobiotin synthase [Acidobacteriota bacterium]
MKGLFVTGTDTGVGKTVAAAALMHCYRGSGRLRYWKPIQTGIEIDNDTATVRRLGACADDEIFDEGVRLAKPVSPHLAARWAGRRIDLAELRGLAKDDDTTWIVEGAGGLLVPINESETMADWIACLKLPVLVVARAGLGTINHMLLTLEALRARASRVAGVIMIGEPNADNRAAIEEYGNVTVVAEMPFLRPLDPGLLGAWSVTHLDPQGRLLEFVR